jgi:hypothetical protein
MSPSTSVQVMTNAVIAEYIHEISVRHRPRTPRTERRGDGRLAARPAAALSRARTASGVSPSRIRGLTEANRCLVPACG